MLYNVNAQISGLVEKAFCGIPTEGIINEEGKVDSEALLAALRESAGSENGLIEDLARNIQNLEAEAEMVKAEKERLAERQKATANRAEHCRSLLGAILGDKGYLSETSALRINRRISESLEVEDQSKVNEKYLRTEIKVSVDKNLAKKAIKAGEVIDGCYIKKTNNIIIK